MSNVEKRQSTEVALPDNLAGVGLEDADQSDLQTPRLKINHNQGTFVLYGEEFHKFNAILLGMLKQRVLWQPQLEENVTPICRSWDFKTGHPDATKWATDFMRVSPADESGFGPVADGEELACADCRLKEFGTDPKGGRAPWCTEQHVYPLLIVGEDGGHQPAILTLQKTALKPSRTYLQPFIVNKRPLFTVVTQLGLDLARQGGNTYSVPNLKRLDETDPARWVEWGDAFRNLKAMLQTPRTEVTDSGDTPVATPARKPKAAAVEVDESSLWDEDNEG
jgi:hypothetical protein